MKNDANTPSPPKHPGQQLKNEAGEQLRGAEKALGETKAELSDRASGLADEAKEAVARKAEDAKQGLSGSLKVLGGAVRAAGDHLSEKGQDGSSRMLGEAASGLERFAESLENRSLGEIFEELRTLGRNNAGGLFAGSMLAGVALGRVFKASEAGEAAPSMGKHSYSPNDAQKGPRQTSPGPSGPSGSTPTATTTRGNAL